MSHPLDKLGKSLLEAADDPKKFEKWVRDLQQSVGAPDGMDLPDEIELEYADGTKETLDTTGLPKFYSHNNPAPQSVIDSWSKTEEFIDDKLRSGEIDIDDVDWNEDE